MRGLLLNVAALLLAGKSASAIDSKPLLQYEINLDLPPGERYAGLLDLSPVFNETVWEFYNEYFRDNHHLTDLLYSISAQRGPESDEQQAEIESLASLSGLPLPFVQSIQMMYELETVMVPIVNLTRNGEAAFPPGYEALSDIPWSAGCTGIIAQTMDGSVSHARNLDFAPEHIMKNLVYDATFTRGGKEIFRSQMVVGYTMVITAARMEEDGYALQRNTRFVDHIGGFKATMDNLLNGVPLNAWTQRKILENATTYDEAVEAFSSARYASTEFNIISGNRKGVIISRSPEGVVHKSTLGETNVEEREDYIIMTNFDFYWNDIREWFDPSGGYGIGHPRRLEAQKLLNATAVGSLTSEFLYEVISSKGVFAPGNFGTIFQAIINIEKGLWNTSQPTSIPAQEIAPPPTGPPPPVFDCSTVTDENECNSHDDSSGYDTCSWCTSVTGGAWSGCVPGWEAAQLPSDAFACDKAGAAPSGGFTVPPADSKVGWGLKCCYGPGQCPSSQHCDYVDKDNCQTGQCLDGEPCYSAQFQTEAKCPNYCKWKEQPINDDGLSIGVCTDNFPYAGKQN